MHAPGQPAGVDRAEFRDPVQAGEIERGGILDDQQDVLVEAPLGGFQRRTRAATRGRSRAGLA